MPHFDFRPLEHDEIGARLGLDFEAAAAISGARFAVLKGPMARLHRALAQFMLDVQTGEHGYTEINPPLLVRDEALFGAVQLPKVADDLSRPTDGRWLIPTAAVSPTNPHSEQRVARASLPLRLRASPPLFRPEPAAARAPP